MTLGQPKFFVGHRNIALLISKEAVGAAEHYGYNLWVPLSREP